MDLSQITVKRLLVQQIRDEIIRGSYLPGSRLRLRDLAAQFKVSTQPIREALSELEAEGLVATEPRKGAVVSQLSVDELLDIYEIRSTLEAMATRVAVTHLTEETFSILNKLITDMDNHMGEVVELVQLNKEFHLTLYKASGRTHLYDLVNTLRNRTAHYLHAYMIDLGGMPSAQGEHRSIIEACRSGDAELASKLMYDHVMAAGNGIVHYVKNENSKQ
ncbi:MAG: GntR family transcriptional regulator [Chloroflexota bacterium]